MIKAVFVSTTNIYDEYGNGGVKASREHYDMLVSVLGARNVKCILFLPQEEYEEDIKEKSDNLAIFRRTEGNARLLLAALFGCRVYMPWEEGKIIKEIASFHPQVFFLDFSIAGRLLRKSYGCKTICFFHNVEADYTRNKMKTSCFYYFPAFLAARRNDRWGLLADKVICFNRRDSDRLLMLYGRGADCLIPVSMKDRFNEARCKTDYEKRILFLGSCFGPNEDGIEWFMKEVMPKLQGVILDIVGLGFEKKTELYSQYENVNVIGSVEDTDEYYYSHLVVVMPIRYGAGMKVKTAEAMMFGRTIIATSEALEGYDIDDNINVHVCDTAEKFAETIQNVFRKPLSKYNVDVRELFLRNYESRGQVCDFAKLIYDMEND